MRKIVFCFALLFFLITTGVVQAGGSFKVIVNNGNPETTISKSNLLKLFLKKTTKWEHGVKVYPVDLRKNSDVRAAFSREILGKSVSAVNSYWQQKLFSGSAVPPVEKATDEDVISFVKSNSGAIGYVSASASTSGVKTLKVSD